MRVALMISKPKGNILAISVLLIAVSCAAGIWYELNLSGHPLIGLGEKDAFYENNAYFSQSELKELKDPRTPRSRIKELEDRVSPNWR